MSDPEKDRQLVLAHLNRQLRTDTDPLSIRPPSGPHIELLPGGGFRILGGGAHIPDHELQAIVDAVGPERDMSPVTLEVPVKTIHYWGETLIQDAFTRRTVALVMKLGLYQPEEKFLATSEIVRRVRSAVAMELTTVDLDGEPVTLLQAFAEDRASCTAAVVLGLYTLAIASLQSKGASPAFQKTVFERAATELGVQESDYETALQIIQRSLPLQQWLRPESPENLLQEIERILNNTQLRAAEIGFLLQAAHVLLDGESVDQLMGDRIIPPGQLQVKQAGTALTESERAQLLQRLWQDSEVALAFLRYIMSRESDVELFEYLRERLGYEAPPSNLPIIETDQPDELESKD